MAAAAAASAEEARAALESQLATLQGELGHGRKNRLCAALYIFYRDLENHQVKTQGGAEMA